MDHMLKAGNYNTYVDALEDAFKISLDKSKFPAASMSVRGFRIPPPPPPINYLIGTRSYFMNLAKQRGFDPLIAHNWYNLSLEEFEVRNWIEFECVAYETFRAIERCLKVAQID